MQSHSPVWLLQVLYFERMLNTHKLVYILPELAYITELLPDKKPHTFSIQSFTQVNGELLNTQDTFIAAHVAKLCSKLEKGEEYHIILPDFLFANTIVTLKETSEGKIKDELHTSILPSLGVNSETHYVETFVLNELRGTSRVQIAAIEKELLLPLKVAAAEAEVTLSGISPLSWAIKSLVSLEPSISVVQLGSHLFTSEHYIGVDQSTVAAVDDVEAAVETIKTLKGAEASIQTVYLIANTVVEKKLKESLSDTLPLQQMADDENDDDRMPSYVRTVIEASMRTLSITEYPVPVFHLGKVTANEKEAYAALAGSVVPEVPTEENAPEVEELPKPDAPKLSTAADTEEEIEHNTEHTKETPKHVTPSEPEVPKIKTIDSETAVPTPAVSPVVPTATAAAAASTAPEIATVSLEDSSADETEQPAQKEVRSSAESKAEKADIAETAAEATPAPTATPDRSAALAAATAVPQVAATTTPVPTAPEKEEEDIDLTQFTQSERTAELPQKKAPAPTPVIKNKSGVGHMIKMILITLGALLATVALGVGIALAYIHFATPKDATDTPAVEVSATPAPTPEPVATPEVASESAALPDNLKILVVNATTKAGYAGTIKTKIEADDLGTVTAGNAKGSYTTKGNFVYLKEENAAVTAALEEATALTLTESDDATAEDAGKKYDVILVLAE